MFDILREKKRKDFVYNLYTKESIWEGQKEEGTVIVSSSKQSKELLVLSAQTEVYTVHFTARISCLYCYF